MVSKEELNIKHIIFIGHSYIIFHQHILLSVVLTLTLSSMINNDACIDDIGLNFYIILLVILEIFN